MSFNKFPFFELAFNSLIVVGLFTTFEILSRDQLAKYSRPRSTLRQESLD